MSSSTTPTTIHQRVLIISCRGRRVPHSLCLSSCRTRPRHGRPPHQQHHQHRLPSSPTSCAMPATASPPSPLLSWGWTQCCPLTCCVRRCSPPTPTSCAVVTTRTSTCILPAATSTSCPSTTQRVILKIPSPRFCLRPKCAIVTSAASSLSRGRCLPLPAFKVSVHHITS
jgi:hypothetical protein